MFVVTAVGSLDAVRAAADALDALDPCPADAVSWFEEGPASPAGGRFRIEAFAADAEAAEAVIDVIRAGAPGLAPRADPLSDADWVAMSLDGLPPVRAGRFVVAGAHALAQIAGGRTKLWIEASEAFGTGHHGTTMGCLLALERILRQRPVRRVLDLGAGSGVLAIAAAKNGALALGVEIDPRAAQIARVNVRQNRIGRRVRIATGDAAPFARRPPRHDVVFANILARPLIRLAPAIAGSVAPGGALVLSGLLATQEPLVRLAYVSRGLTLSWRMRREGWATLVLNRPQAARAPERSAGR